MISENDQKIAERIEKLEPRGSASTMSKLNVEYDARILFILPKNNEKRLDFDFLPFCHFQSPNHSSTNVLMRNSTIVIVMLYVPTQCDRMIVNANLVTKEMESVALV